MLDSGTHWCFNIEKSGIALALGKVIVQNEKRQRLRLDLFQSRQTICLKIKTWKVSKTDTCTVNPQISFNILLVEFKPLLLNKQLKFAANYLLSY